MNNTQILQPLVAFFALVFVVWLTMVVRRGLHLRNNRLSAQAIAMPEQVEATFPPAVKHAGNNFRNLFELPVVFIGICLCIQAAGLTDAFYVNAAWLFVALRVVHSAIHCTINQVNPRFGAWFLSCVVLWTMVARFGLALF